MSEILDWTYAYRKLMVVDTACELDLFTRLYERPRTADELAGVTDAHPRPLEALLDVCVSLGLLSRDGDRYINRPVAAIHLVRGKSLYLGDLFRLFAAEAPQWLSLKELVVTGRSDPKHGPVDIGPRRFTMAMHALALLGEAAALAEAVDLSGRRDLIDIGCGSGAYSVEFCRRNLDLRATLLDRPQVLEVAEKIVAANGMAERIETQPGDMLGDSYGENRDAVLMSDVIYLGSKSSKRMLRSAHRALVSGGLLVIRGYFSDPGGNQNPFGALFDLARLFWGDERETMPLPSLLKWVAEAGFSGIRSFPLTERSTCVVAHA